MSDRSSFLESLQTSSEIGLIVAPDKASLSKIHQDLEALGFQRARNWKEILELPGKVSFFLSPENYSPELDDLVTQNHRGKAHFQIMERKSLNLFQKTINYDTKSMVFAITEEALSELQQEHDLLNRLGPVLREK